MSIYKIKEAKTDDELSAILDLRFKVLRQPWNQSRESATDDSEQTSINAFICDDSGIIIACGRLYQKEDRLGQVRFMAVDQQYQGKGLGGLVLDYLEEKAQVMQLQQIELQARENAVNFYLKCGYVIKEKSFLLWGEIQHYLMVKEL
jgi:N-acetylglutamate synthase-like GNAT family acetyltransferase